MTTFEYQGTELDLFAQAVNWKRYFSAMLQPYLTGHVLEVGAGFGGVTQWLLHETAREWTCLEPDGRLAEQIEGRLADHPLRDRVRVVCGQLSSVEESVSYDAIVYIDVLEHIEDDRAELRRAASMLRPGGRIIVLSPAYNWLYTPFDQALGHFRRYTAASLTAAGPPHLRLERIFYLDSVGVITSIANKLLLRQSSPTIGQIRFWDTKLIPLSRVLDPLLRFRIGRSVIAIWSK